MVPPEETAYKNVQSPWGTFTIEGTKQINMANVSRESEWGLKVVKFPRAS